MSDSFALKYVLVALACLFLVTVFVLYRLVVAHNLTFQQVAGRLGWTTEMSPFLHPRLIFTFRGLPGLLGGNWGSPYSPSRTFVSVMPPPGFPLYLQVTPRHLLDELGSRLGLGGIETRDAAFDSAFTVRGAPEEACLRILDAEVRRLIVEVRAMRRDAWIRLSFHPRHLRVEVFGHFAGADALERFAVRAMEVLGAVLHNLDALEAVDFVVETQEVSPESPLCQICGGALVTNLVTCRRCNVLQHRDCWDFNHGCATFACGSKRRRSVR
jgi:hypothetical protein